MSLNNALVAVSVLPGGIVFGFYLIWQLYILDPDIIVSWPLVTGPGCALIISSVIVVKKRIQEKYTFDNLYYSSLACGFYIVSGFFFMRHSIDIAYYFGFAGSGIAYISSVTYAGYTAANTKKRHRAVGTVYLFYFLGIALVAGLRAFILSDEEMETKCGLVMIGMGILILGVLITNQILNYCNLNNYRTSNDSLWNYYNVRNWLYKGRPDTMAIYQRMDNRYRQSTFAIVKSKESITVFFLLIVSITNFTIFCNVTQALGFTASKFQFNWGGLFWLMLVTTAGVFVCLLLQSVMAPKLIYTIMGIIKCASLVCILVFFDNIQLSNFYVVYFFIYFFCMGALYSIPDTMLLEAANPRNCEIVLSTSYLLQIVVLHVVLYFSKHLPPYKNDLSYFIRTLFIAYVVISTLAIVILQIFSPVSGSLIEIRNYLLGIRRSKTLVTFREEDKIGR